MTVSVLVPYRGDDGGPRDRAWAHVRQWLETRHPGWQVVQGACPPGPWCKALAVGDALTRSQGDTLAIVDADVICDGVGPAVEAVQSGAPWAVPHRRVYRLTEAATQRILAGGPLPPAPDAPRRARRPGERPRPWSAPDVVEAYTGVIGGGMVVLPRALYKEGPLDPRFVQWGGEDSSWGRVLTALAGPPLRLAHPLWHLHHPPQPRITRAVGSLESQALARRYRAATTPAEVRALLAELALSG